jgi:predicted ATP-grasp superfamily ATP-dependent carboligase
MGAPCSAQFLALRGLTILLGVTRQLIGLREVGAVPFAWCGALTPAAMAPEILETMRLVGTRVAAAGGLQGLFGCDFVVEAGVPWLTEVNPRYTAAMELFDYTLRHSLVAWHVQACGGPLRGSDRTDFKSQISNLKSQLSNLKSEISNHKFEISERILGKIVLFAETDLAIGDATAHLRDPRDGRLPKVADLPAPGSRIPAGMPVCTLFAQESTEEGCLARLVESATEFRFRYLSVRSSPA